MKVQKQIWVLIPLLVISCASFSQAKNSRLVLPENTLKSNQLNALFVGSTVESVSVSKGRKSLTYYDPNGEVRQKRDQKIRAGQWRITKRGRICLQMENNREKCRIIVRENGTYKKFIVKKSGNHKHVVNYKRFMPGNPMGL